MPPSLTCLRRRCCFSRLQQADTQLERARQLIKTQKRQDVEAALVPLDTALELCPDWETALELKARALLYLKRFKDVVELLHEFLPSSSSSSSEITSKSPTDCLVNAKEKTRLLSEYLPEGEVDVIPRMRKRFSSVVSGLVKSKFSPRLHRICSKGSELRRQWRYLVLGQACCHLGMMDDAMVLLQNGKKTASAASRRQSNCMRDDNFCLDMKINMTAAESALVNHMLGNIKFLLRRRAAAIAALEAGLYAESVRHFSKIIEGRKGAPQGFIADCYLHRAIAYQATGRVVDAIADCNRNLALNPNCTRALSVRASLYEMVRCFSECLLDLQQLKMIYEAALRSQSASDARYWNMHRQQANSSDIDFAGGLDYINSKIIASRQRLSSSCSLDAYTILDMPRNCTLEDVEKAYLLLSLKHRSDKAVYFVDRCEFVDDRNIETVKEEARASSLRLSHLIHKAYIKLLASIVAATEEEADKQNDWFLVTASAQQFAAASRLPCVNSPVYEETLLGDDQCDDEAGCNKGCRRKELDTKGERVNNVNNDNYHQEEVGTAGCRQSFLFHPYEQQKMVSPCHAAGGKSGHNLSSTVLANAISQALSTDISPIDANDSIAVSSWINTTPDWGLSHIQSLPCHIAY